MLNFKGNLFELAEKQLNKELDGGRIKDFSTTDIIDKAFVIRKELDRLSSKGKVRNIHTKKLQSLYSKREKRRLKYLTTGY